MIGSIEEFKSMVLITGVSVMADGELQCWSGGHRRSATALRQGKQGLQCPRCESPNTKFCYYNNYSLSQPRHFCKACRRYWTEGGALRNVPVGGGCRKSRKFRSPAESRRHEIVGLPPPMVPASEPVLFSPVAFNYNAAGSTDGINVSAVELLGSANEDLHWKLQKQKMAVLDDGRELIVYSQKEPTPAEEACGVRNSTAWFSECSNYGMLPSSSVVNINSTSYWNGGVPGWSDKAAAGFITPLP